MNLGARIFMSRWKKTLIAIAALLATGSYLTVGDAISAQGKMSSHNQIIAFAEWQLFSPKEERFSILMPIGNIERKIAGNGSEREFTFQTEQEVFKIGLLDMPEKVIGNEAEILANIAAKMPPNYRLVSQRKFGLNGNPGIELNYVIESYPNKLTIRYIIVQRTMYIIMAVSDSPTRTQSFLNSFRLR